LIQPVNISASEKKKE